MLRKVKELMLDNVKPEDIIGSKTKTVAHIISGSDLFYPGETELSEEGINLLKNKFTKEMVENIKELIIEGHTDDKEFDEFPGISKVYNNNTELSAARSLKVVELLKTNLELGAINVGIRAYGDKRPLRPNTTDVNRAFNRRVEIKITTEIMVNEIESKDLKDNISKTNIVKPNNNK
jgi:chemotaxis protein MotB